MKKPKKGKIIFWIVFIVVAIILYFQNRSFFMYEHSDNLSLDLFVFDFSISPMPMAIFFIAAFLIGYIIALSFCWVERFRLKKNIQELNEKLSERNKQMDSLQHEVNALKEEDRGKKQAAEPATDAGAQEQK